MTIGRAVLIRTYGATGITILLALATSIIVARFLGPEARGLLLVLTFWPFFIAASLYLSLNEATALAVAQDTGGEDRSGPPGQGAATAAAASSGLAMHAIAFTAVTPVTLLILPLVLAGREDSFGLVMGYTLAFVPAMFLDLHFKAVLQGRGQFDALNVLRLIQPALYAAMLLGLLALGDLTITNVMTAMAGSTALSAVAGMTMAWTYPLAAAWTRAKDILKIAWRFHVANMLVYITNEADKLIVLSFLSDREIGYFGVALAFSTLGSSFVVQSLLVTVTSEMSLASTPDKRIRVAQFSVNDATFLLLAINGVLAVSAPIWLPLLYGSAFAPAVVAAVLFIAAGTLKGLRQVIDRVMRAANSARSGIWGEAVTLAVMIPAGIAGVHLGGLPGLAIGVIAAQMAGLLAVGLSAANTLGTPITALVPLRRPMESRILAAILRRARRWTEH